MIEDTTRPTPVEGWKRADAPHRRRRRAPVALTHEASIDLRRGATRSQATASAPYCSIEATAPALLRASRSRSVDVASMLRTPCAVNVASRASSDPNT